MAADKENREKGRALKNEREVVLLALLSHEKNETFSNILVRRTLDSCAQMSTVEKAFIKRLLEGVIERKTELDTRIENFTGRSVSRLHPAVRQILRMGIYQIYYMDAVPDSAVCNEAVQLAKRHAPARLSGFVNGVLRNAARQAAAEEKAADLSGAGKGGTERKTEAGGMGHAMDADAMVRKMCVEYSMPAWLVRMWSEQLGMEETAKLLGALMEIRPVSARLSGRLSEEEGQDLLAQLQAAGVIVEEGRWLSDCRYLRRTSDLRRLPGPVFHRACGRSRMKAPCLLSKRPASGGTKQYWIFAPPPAERAFWRQNVWPVRRQKGREPFFPMICQSVRPI